MSQRTPSIKQVCLALIGRRLAETCVAVPASVMNYDTSKQVADVKPLVQMYRVVDGERVAFSCPVVPHCPVKWPGAGGFFFACPLQPGDQVLLVFSDRALERWYTTGLESEPGDDRIHSIKDAFVLPELRHSGRPIAGLSSSKAIIGKEGGPVIAFGSDVQLGATNATEPVLYGSAWKTAFDIYVTALKAWVQAVTTPNSDSSAITSATATLNTAKGTFDGSYAAALSPHVKVK